MPRLNRQRRTTRAAPRRLVADNGGRVAFGLSAVATYHPRAEHAGEVPEWPIGHAWKACERVTVPRVRIPPSPLNLRVILRCDNAETNQPPRRFVQRALLEHRGGGRSHTARTTSTSRSRNAATPTATTNSIESCVWAFRIPEAKAPGYAGAPAGRSSGVVGVIQPTESAGPAETTRESGRALVDGRGATESRGRKIARRAGRRPTLRDATRGHATVRA